MNANSDSHLKDWEEFPAVVDMSWTLILKQKPPPHKQHSQLTNYTHLITYRYFIYTNFINFKTAVHATIRYPSPQLIHPHFARRYQTIVSGTSYLLQSSMAWSLINGSILIQVGWAAIKTISSSALSHATYPTTLCRPCGLIHKVSG